jgi:Beta-carotene isomerase D27-like, C-terminal
MEPSETKHYHDNAFDRLFIWLFSHKMGRILGGKTKLSGYDGFVDLSKQMFQGRSTQEQQRMVTAVLRSLIPAPVLWSIRTLFSPTQLVCELNAWFAARLFEWLVGPCTVREVDVTTEKGTVHTQKSGVHIEKCRYLESSQCVGMCVNMCKLPTQTFFTQEFGIPLTMTPNFEDYSCEMVFGQIPPPLDAEEAGHQPCLIGRCTMASTRATACPKLST